MGRGPLKVWLHQIGKATENKCSYNAPQNAVHILRCSRVADGKGRTLEEAEKDPKWCEAVYEFLTKEGEAA